MNIIDIVKNEHEDGIYPAQNFFRGVQKLYNLSPEKTFNAVLKDLEQNKISVLDTRYGDTVIIRQYKHKTAIAQYDYKAVILNENLTVLDNYAAVYEYLEFGEY